jgi:hypothetical protein
VSSEGTSDLPPDDYPFWSSSAAVRNLFQLVATHGQIIESLKRRLDRLEEQQ